MWTKNKSNFLEQVSSLPKITNTSIFKIFKGHEILTSRSLQICIFISYRSKFYLKGFLSARVKRFDLKFKTTLIRECLNSSNTYDQRTWIDKIQFKPRDIVHVIFNLDIIIRIDISLSFWHLGSIIVLQKIF